MNSCNEWYYWMYVLFMNMFVLRCNVRFKSRLSHLYMKINLEEKTKIQTIFNLYFEIFVVAYTTNYHIVGTSFFGWICDLQMKDIIILII